MLNIIKINSNYKVVFSDDNRLVVESKMFDLEVAEMSKPLEDQDGFYILTDKQLKQKLALNAKKNRWC